MYASIDIFKCWSGAPLGKRIDRLFRNALLVLLSACLTAHANTLTLPKGASVQTCFSYTRTCEAQIVQLIAHAKKRILLASYSFTSNEIAKALKNARARGIKMQLVLDKSNLNGKYSRATYLANAGVDIRINSRYAIMHHKFIIVDQAVGFGSMNFTRAGDRKNAENFNIFHHAPNLVRVYEQEFVRLYDESKPYAPSL